MRTLVAFLVVVGLLTCPRLAMSDDAGPPVDAADLEAAGGGCAEDGSCENDAGVASDAPVIACDGDLCDTLQGRPSCSVAEGAGAYGSLDAGWVAGAIVVGSALVVRRRRRGA